jgi:hypothetical protein
VSRNVIYGLIVVVLIMIVVDLLGRWRMHRPPSKRRGKSRAADEAPLSAWGSAMNPRSDFPATTFSDEDAESIAGAGSHSGPAHGDSPFGASQRRPARNTFNLPPAGTAPAAALTRGAALGPAQAHVSLCPVDDPLEKSVRKRVAPEAKAFKSVRLLCLSGPDRGRSYPVVAAGTTVGRHPSCQVVVDDRRVSGRHARLGIVLGRIMLRDLDSTNGTLLNAHPDRVVGETELHAGDTIYLGGRKGAQFQVVID